MREVKQSVNECLCPVRVHLGDVLSPGNRSRIMANN